MHGMSSAAASVSDFLRFSPRRELLLGAALTAAFAALVLAFGPAPGDAPVHLYRTFLVRDGALVWDNFWYSGTYPLASYSLLYYLPAALVGNLPLVFFAAVASTVLFASIALRQWGTAALWPSRVRRPGRGADVHRALRVLARLHGDARHAQVAAAAATVARGRPRRAHGRVQPARLRLPLPHRRCVGSLARADRAPAPLVRGGPGGRGRHRGADARPLPGRGRRCLPVPLDRLCRGSRRHDARRPPRQEGSRSRAARRVLCALGARERRRLRRAVAARGQLDAAERLHLSRHAPHGEPRRLPAAASRRAR